MKKDDIYQERPSGAFVINPKTGLAERDPSEAQTMVSEPEVNAAEKRRAQEPQKAEPAQEAAPARIKSGKDE